MWLLKFIRIKDVGILLTVLLLVGSFWLYNQNQSLIAENSRVSKNYQNALKIDSLNVAIFKVKKKIEFEELINRNKELKKLVSSTRVKTKHIQSLYYQQQQYIDSLKKKMDVSGLVEKIRKDIPAVVPWKDSTDCSIIEGNVSYRADSLGVNVVNKQFNNETILIEHKGRRKPVKWLFGLRLGSREVSFTPKSKCGNTKVTIVKKER